MGTELIDFDQDDEGVNVKVRRLQGQDGTAQEETIRASYLVGADGARGGRSWHHLNFRLLQCFDT